MQRWKLIIEYKGCQFNGWQSQKDLTGIQDSIQSAIYKFSGESTKIYGAGRTDSGVHALGQVAHFDIKRETNQNEIREALNSYLRPDLISIIKVFIILSGIPAVPIPEIDRSSQRTIYFKFIFL